MPRFQYSFLRADGAVGHAVAEATDEAELSIRLQREKLYLLRASPERQWLNWKVDFGLKTWRPSLVLALHEIGSLLKAGLPIDRAVNVVADLLPNKNLKEALVRVHSAVRRGVPLADALGAEDKYFSPLIVNFVRAGEAGNTLDDGLLRLAEYLRRQDEVKSQILIALVYPAILVLVGVAALVLLATVVLPQLAPIFADAGKQMPLPTRMILEGAAVLRSYGILLVVGTILMLFLLLGLMSQPATRLRWDRAKLRIPMIGDLILTTQTARFARTVGTLLSSGVALPAALNLARQTLTNLAMSDAVAKAIAQVRAGRSLTVALRDTGIFPALSVQLTSVGEESGHLDDLLLHQAQLYERSGSRRIEALVAILVPLLTILIGVSVAGILASILLAVMKLNDLAS